jgi:hypothetical protein
MKNAGWILKWIALALTAVAALGLAAMLLWNWLVPSLFNGPVITFWQALGLLALSKILFFGFGRGPGGQAGRWKHKWAQLSPEQREQLKARLKERWCDWERPRPGAANTND